jgi:flotillin
MEIITISIIVTAIVSVFIIMMMAGWWRIVPPSEAHLVVTARSKFVVSSDIDIAKTGKKAYFAIPHRIPFIGRNVRMMDITIKEIVVEQETYEKNQARYNVRSSTKFRINDVLVASETFVDEEQLDIQLQDVVKACVRAITVKYDVVEARADRQKMEGEIRKEISDNLAQWGLQLVNFQLVEFKDTKDSQVISNISKRREVEIESDTRQQNAEKYKMAVMKEAEAKENSSKREIERDEQIAKRQQAMNQIVAEQEKLAQEKLYEVIQVKTIKQAEIDKEKAIIRANQDKEVQAIQKDQKQLEGEGEKLRLEQIAIGNAATIRENGAAEAKAKDLLQESLNKFGDGAIRALVAEKIVAMQQTVGVESAKALANAEMKVFVGGDGAKNSFDLGQMVSALNVGNEGAANSVLNALARPNDLGFTNLPKLQNNSQAKKKEGDSEQSPSSSNSLPELSETPVNGAKMVENLIKKNRR